jgi:hypothetical protein
MKYNTKHYPTAEQAETGRHYIARWDHREGDGAAGTYDEAEYDAYEHEVLRRLGGTWTTETDDQGVYLVRQTRQVIEE